MTSDAFQAVRALLGDAPFKLLKDEVEKKAEASDVKTITTTKNIVLKDGTYAAVTSTETIGGPLDEAMPHLRKLVCGGDVLLGTVACVCLTKMALKDQSGTNALTSGALVTVAGIGRLAEVMRGARVGVHADCLDRLSMCVRILLDPNVRAKMSSTFLDSCHEAYSSLVAKQKATKTQASEAEKKGLASQADDLIQFRQLRAQAVQGGIEVDLMDADDISRAIGAGKG